MKNITQMFNTISVTLIICLLSTRSVCSSDTSCEIKPSISAQYQDSNSSLKYEQQVVIEKINGFSITCTSSKNIEWDYRGMGAPSKVREESEVKTVRQENKTSFCIVSTLTFLPSATDLDLSDHSGEYICREMRNTSNQETIHVFFPKTDAPALLNSGKTLTIEEKDLESITIPCEASNPNADVQLYKRGKEGSFEVLLRSEETMKYDPRYGFKIYRTGLEGLIGEYKCTVSDKVAATSSNEKFSSYPDVYSTGSRTSAMQKDFVVFNVIKPKSFQAFPDQNEVYTSSVLNLTCEAEEPVVLKEVLPIENDYMMYPDEEIVETTEKTEQKTHVANYFEKTPVVGSFGEFQCVSESDSKVLHTWKYRVINKKREKLSGIRYNKRDKSFTCKTMTGNPGKLSFINCRTPSECRINRICLQQKENCRGYSSLTKMVCQRSNHQCTKIINRLASGIIRCVGEGVDELLEYTEVANSTNLHFDFSKLKVEDTKLIMAKHIENITVGDEIKVSFKWGQYFFMTPLKWGFIYKNGSSIDTEPLEGILTSNGFYSVKKVSVKVSSDEIEAIAALIPLRDSPGYSVSKIPLQVQPEEIVHVEETTDTEAESSATSLSRMDLELTTVNTLSDQTEINDATVNSGYDETTVNINSMDHSSKEKLITL